MPASKFAVKELTQMFRVSQHLRKARVERSTADIAEKLNLSVKEVSRCLHYLYKMHAVTRYKSNIFYWRSRLHGDCRQYELVMRLKEDLPRRKR